MIRFFRRSLGVLALTVLLVPLLTTSVFAQSLSEILNLGNRPVNYDSGLILGRGYKSADSIDTCLQKKEFNYNEVHDIWVQGLVRCKYNTKRVLSKATSQGVSTAPEDEKLCSGRRDGEIIVHGVPSEDEARRWSERCSYLGTLGGAGPIQPTLPTTQGTTPTTTGAPRVAFPTTTSGTQPDLSAAERAAVQSGSAATAGGVAGAPTNFSPVYKGTGVQVPKEDLIPQGISRKRSLSELIIFYTNVTLPYVSVVSVFAFVASGIFYILSFANEELSGKAKTIMTYVVIGIVIIFSAYTIVNTLLNLISFQ